MDRLVLMLVLAMMLAAGPATKGPSTQGPTTRPEPARLHGAWTNTMSGMVQTYTFIPDGTWKMEWGGAMRRSESGTWKLQGPDLNLVVKASTNPSRVGKAASFEIRRLTDDKLVMAQGDDPNATVTFEKVK